MIQLAEVPIQVIGLAIYGDEVTYDTLFQVAADAREALLQVNGGNSGGAFTGTSPRNAY